VRDDQAVENRRPGGTMRTLLSLAFLAGVLAGVLAGPPARAGVSGLGHGAQHRVAAADAGSGRSYSPGNY
jgi:hypothetical protein